MWSIGNEIPEQWSQEGMEIAKHLQDLCHLYDPSVLLPRAWIGQKMP